MAVASGQEHVRSRRHACRPAAETARAPGVAAAQRGTDDAAPRHVERRPAPGPGQAAAARHAAVEAQAMAEGIHAAEAERHGRPGRRRPRSMEASARTSSPYTAG